MRLVVCCVCGAGGCHLTGVTAGDQPSSAVDLYNSASGTWSTAQLSVGRCCLGATSVGNVAIFAGGYTGVTAGSERLNAVDLYNIATGTWSTAQLSVGRDGPAATSVGNVAIFAGGYTGNFSLTLFGGGLLFGLTSVGDAVTFACLRRAACCLPCMRCRRLPSHGVTAGRNAVDLYNSATGTWSTAQLSVGRCCLGATSVGNVAIFAGGYTGNFSFTLFVEGLLFGLMSVGDAVTFACLRRAACCLLCLRCRRLPSHGCHSR